MAPLLLPYQMIDLNVSAKAGSLILQGSWRSIVGECSILWCKREYLSSVWRVGPNHIDQFFGRGSAL
jgi:hypothetical protein